MRHLALALAASVLGTGCIIATDDDGCDPRTITVEWVGFTTGDGNRLGCAAAGVSFVDIYMDGAFVETWSCADGGALITDVQAGVYTLTVEGVESNGRIAFREELDVNANSCGDRLVRVSPAEGYVDLQYAFTPDNVCAADPSYLWFSIYDEVAGFVTAAVDSSSSSLDKVRYTCPDLLLLPLPAGPHTLDWMQEMVPTGPSTFAVTGARCTATGFNVVGGDTVGVPVVMDGNATVPCL